jgi:predicted dehydrogenase
VTTPGRDLRTMVVGCGSIGSRHARNLRTLGVGRIACCDLDGDRAGRLADEIASPVAGADVAALLREEQPHVVLVCTPPTAHVSVASRGLAAGAHVFCEKPLAATMDGVDDLLVLAAARRRFVMVGMCYRYHAGLVCFRDRLVDGTIGRLLTGQLWAGQYLPDWHPWADYRTEYSARRALGGGVLLDSIHSFDVVRWAFGRPVEVTGMLATVSDLELDTEDVAAALIRLDGGAIVHVHVDYLQRHPQSRIEAVGSEGTLVWERTGVRWRRAGDAGWTEEPCVPDPNEMYLAELRELLECVAAGRPPALDGAEGRATLALALAVRRSAETGRRVLLAASPVPLAGVA